MGHATVFVITKGSNEPVFSELDKVPMFRPERYAKAFAWFARESIDYAQECGDDQTRPRSRAAEDLASLYEKNLPGWRVTSPAWWHPLFAVVVSTHPKDPLRVQAKPARVDLDEVPAFLRGLGDAYVHVLDVHV